MASFIRREHVIAVYTMENPAPDQYLTLVSFWVTLMVPRGFSAASVTSCCHAAGHRALPTSAEEETPQQAEPQQDVLHTKKPVLYELSCRSPSNWHKIKHPCSYSNLHWGMAQCQVPDLKRPELNKLSIEPIMLKSNIWAKNIQSREKVVIQV